MIELKCDQRDHQYSPVSAICLRKDCPSKSACCIQCMPNHRECANFKFMQEVPEAISKLKTHIVWFKDAFKQMQKYIETLEQVVDQRFQKIEDYNVQPNLTNFNRVGELLKVQMPQDIQRLEKQKKNICLMLEKFMDILLNTEGQQNLSISLVASMEDKDQAKNYYEEGFELFNMESFLEAITNFDKAIQINKEDVDSWHWKGKSHKYLGQSLFNLGKFEEARDCYDKSIKIDPKENESFYWKGYVLLKMNNFKDAIPCFDEQIKIQPSLDCYLQKGYSLEKLENLKDAEQCYVQGLERFPNNRILEAKLSFRKVK